MEGKEHTQPGMIGGAPVLRPWEPMALTRVGAFAEVLRGNSGTMGDSGTMKKA